jgi:serine/threonine protein kinase
MDLADFSLSAYLSDASTEQNPALMISFCEDIAAGLDVLHACNFVHGDLKPDNVLLYKQNGRIVAKLGDFGLCMTEIALTSTSRKTAAGTPGWQAPEVESGTWFELRELSKADNYSYGLVIWSILLHGGRVPPSIEGLSRHQLAVKALKQGLCDLEPTCRNRVVCTVESLLEPLPFNRPTAVRHLLQAPKDELTR